MGHESRAALVTGAAGGLAQGIVLRLAQAGYRLAFTYRPGGTLPAQTERMLAGLGVTAVTIALDAEIAGETERAVHEAEERLGRVDAFVHAVGPMIVRRFVRSSMEEYRTMIDSNLSSAVEGAFAVLPGMRERRFGRLVYFGMNGSHVTAPARGMAFYGAAKAGLLSFARTLALEEAEWGITVNAIEPGDIRKKQLDRAAAAHVPARNPTGHAGSWEDIADAVRFLIADESSFINGATLAVNGGLATAAEPSEKV